MCVQYHFIVGSKNNDIRSHLYTNWYDIDLAIAFNNFTLSDLERRLRTEDLALLCQQALDLNDNTLSVVDINTVPSYLAFNIVEYGEVILSKNKKREFKEIERVYSIYEDEMITVRSNEKLLTVRAKK